ncbi:MULTISPECIES: NERD domain-containing protein [unclassified Mesobacillus]|uniref:NERD domain-containing protein n=1 Tax=unclassified Mesobacillus TaxID=2675270 RepID=UPI00203B0674|nr:MULTISPECIES: NERD domain-containing protein [unclassified Mesobacillus]MCM3124116.1 NERD domain-containing protein [Mesobacillus sp. MER 33]MCM3233965.1 NERD domain-containing protein [Mesobacillus sp. MER 48]
MIVKRRKVPLRLKINGAILRRLPDPHSKRAEVMQDSMRFGAGHKGEVTLDYYTSLLHEDAFHIFQGLRLKTGETHFQMDSLLLSPSFAIIIESKNMAGTLTFNSQFNQMDRSFNDKTDTFDDPLLQAKRHRILLLKWLNLHHYPMIPIEYLVFSSNPSTALRNPTNDPEVYLRVCPPGRLIFKIEEFLSKYKKDVLTLKEHKKLSKLLLKSDQPPESHLPKFQINPAEYLTGVQCPSCTLYAMERYSGTWNCPHCGATAKDAHLQALEDYFLLINPTINNKQFRSFVHLPSQKLASKLLANSNLIATGATKSRSYKRK